MSDQPFNVLFLCNGSSASLILAEAILNRVGAGTSKITLSIRRDRSGTFDPKLIAKYQRRFPDFDARSFPCMRAA